MYFMVNTEADATIERAGDNGRKEPVGMGRLASSRPGIDLVLAMAMSDCGFARRRRPVDADLKALVGRPQHAGHILAKTSSPTSNLQLRREMGRDRPGQGFAIGEVGHIDIDTRRDSGSKRVRPRKLTAAHCERLTS